MISCPARQRCVAVGVVVIADKGVDRSEGRLVMAKKKKDKKSGKNKKKK